MLYITNHKIIKDKSGYIVLLYLDEQLAEFSKEEKDEFQNSVKNYIKKNVPNTKITTVKIMLGSILIASIPFIYINSTPSTNINKNNVPTQIINKLEDVNKESIDTNKENVNKKTDNNLDTINENSAEDKKNKVENSLPDKISNNHYTVKQGDTLFDISREYNITVEQLKNANGLISDIIYIGQILNIPGEQTIVLSPALISNPDNILVLVNKNNNLPSDYVPENLVVPNVPFPFKEFHTKKLMRKEAALALEQLFEKAKQDGIYLYGLSGYRSYNTQKAIFTSNVSRYGEQRANQFSAKPGQSEHQTGLAMDVTCKSVNFVLTQRLGETKEGKWIKNNTAEFGFIIRYEKGKENITGYQYEPWHIRYVGKEAAKEVLSKNITLDEYLAKK